MGPMRLALRSTVRWRAVGALAAGLLVAGCGGGEGGEETGPEEPRLGAVEGTVQDETGAGVAGAILTLARTGFPARKDTSDATGAFSFSEVEEGFWELTVLPPEGYDRDPTQVFPLEVTVVANEVRTLVVRLVRLVPPTGAVAGRVTVTGATVEGVQGAEVVLTPPEGAALTRTTDASGSYRFDDLEPGPYNVRVNPPAGFTLAEGEPGSRDVTVAAGETVTVDFALQRRPSGSVVEIRLVNFAFEPDSVAIAPGTTVRWVNTTSTFHTVTPDGHSEWQRWTTDAQGQTFEHTFSAPGTFPYFCEPHRSLGMTGTVVVQ